MTTPVPRPVRKKRRRRPFVVRHWRALAILPAALAGAIVLSRIIGWPGPAPRLTGYIGDAGSLRTEYAHYLGKPLTAVEIQHQFEQAAARVRKSDYSGAAQLLEDSARQAPIPVIFNDLGIVYVQLNDPSRAIGAFREALARDAAYSPVLLNLNRLKNLKSYITDSVSSEVEPNDRLETANILIAGHPVAVDIQDSPDQDYFRFTTPPAPRDLLEISLVNRSTTLAPRLRIYDDEGLLLPLGKEENKPGESLSVIVGPAPDTTLYLQVAGVNDTVGAYTLAVKALKSFDRYEPNDDIFNARKIALGERIDANIMDSGDTDFYSFESPRNGTVSIEIENHSDTLVPALTTFTSDMRTSGFGPDADRPGGSLHHTMQVQHGLTYYLQVWSQGGTSGDYSLIIQ